MRESAAKSHGSRGASERSDKPDRLTEAKWAGPRRWRPRKPRPMRRLLTMKAGPQRWGSVPGSTRVCGRVADPAIAEVESEDQDES